MKNLLSRYIGHKHAAFRRRVFTAVIAVCVLFQNAFPLFAYASGPSSNRVLNYQLRLTDAGGNAVANGTYNVKLTLYTAASGGTQKYTACSSDGTAVGTPTAVTATFTSGSSSILIGDTGLTCASGSAVAIPTGLFSETALYLGVTVAADAEMTPRKRVVASGYSLNADKLDDLETSDAGGTGAYVPVTNASGLLSLTGNPTGSAAVITANPAAAQISLNDKLLALQNDGTDKFTVDTEGDVNISGDITGTIVTLDGTDLANGAGTAATTLILDDTAGFTAGNYVFVNATYAKIVTVDSGTNLTISPALTWADNDAVTEVRIPELGGANTTSTLANRFGRGYFVDGIVTGNGSTRFTDGKIESSAPLSINALSNQAVSFGTGTVSFGNAVTVTGTIASTASMTLGGAIDINGNVLAIDADNASTGANVSIVANQGSDADGTLRYNAATNKWEFNNDGGAFVKISDGLLDLHGAYDNDADGSDTILTTNATDGDFVIAGDQDVRITSTGLTAVSGTLTVNGDVTLGNGTADLTSVSGALYLGVIGGSASDPITPTPADGMIYYNSHASVNKFRCYENASWKDCVVVPTDVNGSGATGGVTLWTAAMEVGDDAPGFSWANSTDRLGIGDDTPLATLTVGADDAFQVAGATGNIVTDGTFSANGAGTTSFGGNLTVGTVTSNGTGTTAFDGNLTVSTFTANGTGVSSFGGNLTVGTVTVLDTATMTFLGALNVTSAGASTISGNLQVDGFVDLGNGPLDVTTATGRIVTSNHAADQGAKIPTNSGLPLLVTGTVEGDIVWDNANAHLFVYDGVQFRDISAEGITVVGNAVTSGTVGSALFIGTGPVLAQDNANYFWDDSTDRLGLGDATPAATLTVGSGDLFTVDGSTGNIVTAGVIAASGGGSSSVGGATTVTGNVTVNGSGTSSFAGALNVTNTGTSSYTGSLQVNGNATLGDAAGDTVTASGRLHAPAHAASQGFRVPISGTLPTSVTGTSEGDIVWDSADDALYLYTGSIFKTVGGSNISGTGASTGVTFWSAAHTLEADALNFVWDTANDRLGIGTASPTATLSVGSGSAFRVDGATGNVVTAGTFSATGLASYAGTLTVNGNVSLGDAGDTVSVSGRLHASAHAANSGLRLPTNVGDPSPVTGSAEGDIVWNTTNKSLYVHDGGSFLKVTGNAIVIANAIGAGTAGSPLFVTSGPALGQDNANFFWDEATSRLSLGGDATPDATLSVGATSQFRVDGATGDVQTTGTFTANGSALTLGNAAGDVTAVAGRLTTPAHSSGALRTPTFSGGPSGVAGSSEGDIVWDSTNDELYVYDSAGGFFHNINASGVMSIGGVVPSGTVGSTLFVGPGPDLTQDNGNFFWDDSSNRLGIGDASPAATLSVGAGDLFQVAGASGNITTAGTLIVSGTDPSSIGGSLSANGNIALGNAAADRATVNGEFRIGLIANNGGTGGLSDPTGEIGLAYFNTTSQKYRCYEALPVGWRNCDRIGDDVTGSGTSGQTAYWSTASAITGENAFFWDDPTQRLGLGDATPEAELDLTTTDASGGLFIDNLAATGNPIVGFQLTGTSLFTLGVNDSAANDDFVISGGSALGTNDLFTVDGATGNVAIGQNFLTNAGAAFGNASTDRTTVTGEFRAPSAATDPASPVNGMFYYNTVSNFYRCYQAGVWTNCFTPPNILSGAITGSTVGSTLFVNAGPVLAQDNPNFFWNDTSNYFGLGTASPATRLATTGLTLSTAADGTVGAANLTASLTKNDANARTFAVAEIKPTLNAGGSNGPAGYGWTTRTSAADNQWTSVAYGNGLFVAVSQFSGGIMTSPDAVTWTSRTPPNANRWFSVTYANGQFVAVSIDGAGNRVMTSPDGITWTSRTSAADKFWFSVTYGNGLFVAVNADAVAAGAVMTSPDGITWTSRTGGANQWYSVVYGNGLFVAVARSGLGNRVMTSPDGITWTSRTSAADNSWNSVTYGNGLFVAVSLDGSGNRVMTSPDGITWTLRTSAANEIWSGVTYGDGLFVAVAGTGSGNRVMTSPDGINWTSRTSAADNSWYGITYANGVFVAVAGSGTGNRVMTSSGTTLNALAINTTNTAVTGTTTNLIKARYGASDRFTVSSGGILTAVGDLQANGDVTTLAATATFFNDTATTIALGTGTGGTKTINVGTGAAVANTLNIGGTGANTIAIGNTQTAGSLALGAAMTTGTITIGGAGAQTGTLTLGNSSDTNITNIATGTGATTLNLATGITSAKTINIGTGAAIANAIEIGGTGANTIAIGNTQTAGSISLGAAMTDGTLNLGGTGAHTGNIVIGNSTVANTITIGGTGTLNLTGGLGATGCTIDTNGGLACDGTITGSSYASNTGAQWTTRTAPTANFWNGVAYGNGTFVAVGRSGSLNHVMTSPDGVNWTTRTSTANNQWQAVVYGNGLFVAVSDTGTGNRVMTSPDGITWTSRSTSGIDNAWYDVTYGNGLFVAVAYTGSANRVMTSPDGIIWTTRSTSGFDNAWDAVTYGNGRFVAVANTGTNRVMTSTDGITWTASAAAAANQWYGVTYGNGLFVAVSNTGTGNRVMTSPNGTTWTIRTSAADRGWTGVTYGNGLFVAVGDGGTNDNIMTSPDGITWTLRTNPVGQWEAIGYGNGTFVVVSDSGSGDQVMTSGFSEETPFSHNNTRTGGLTQYGNLTIGSTAPSAIQIGNVGEVSSIALGTAMTTGTITIGGSGAQTGTMTFGESSGTNITNIGTGTGATTLNLGTSATNAKTINIGTGASVSNDITIGGTGANVIAIGTTQTAGTISLGAAMTTGTLNIGGTGAHTGSIAIGNSTAANTISIGGTGASTINLAGGSSDTGCTIDGSTGSLTCSGILTAHEYYDAGITWSQQTASSSNTWTSVAYGNGLFVAVASSGTGDRVMTSPDGINWTTRTSAADNTWLSITYGNGLFVAVASSGTGNRVMTSPDGIAWTTRTSATDSAWTSVAYGNGTFVAVNATGVAATAVMTSLDGLAWTSRTAPNTNAWTGVTFGNGVFAAVSNTGTGNRVMTSPDGITWTARTSAADNSWTSLVYGKGVFVAVASSGTGNRVMTSPDGTTWTSRTSAADNSWNGITFGNGLFVAVASTGTGNRVMTSPDGIVWITRTSPSDVSWLGVAHGNGAFTAVSNVGTTASVMTSGTIDESPFSHNNTRTGGLTAYGNLTLGGPGANAIQLGNATDVTSIALGTAMTTGTISIGSTAAQTGTMTFGESSATQITNIGTGTGATTLNLGTGATNAKTINIGTGASMANTVTFGGNGANVIAIGNTQTAGSISLGAAMTTGTLSIGGTGAHTGNIVIGNSIAANTLSIGGGGATATTINFAGGSADTGCTIDGATGNLACSGTITAGAYYDSGIDWTSQTSATDNTWRSVTYGNGLFVAVAESGTGNRVMTSPDGINWTSRTSAADNSWQGVTYGNGLFVAVSESGTGNRVMTSPDGITWTSRTSATDLFWQSVTYGNGIFVAVSLNGAGNRVMTSPDGMIWTSRTSQDASWRDVTYGNGLFVAVAESGTGNRVMTSPDGITWTIRTSAADNDWQSVAYGNGLFVAVANTGTGNRVMTSPDGSTWTIRVSATDNSWQTVTYGSGLFVAVAASGTGNRVMTSPDGISWISRTSAADNSWFEVAYGNGTFAAVAASGTGNRVMISGTPDEIPFSANNIIADGLTAYGNLTLGSTGANTIQIGNVNPVTSIALGTAMTTGTISIGGTGAQTGTMTLGESSATQITNIGTGTGATTLNLGTGATNAKTINIGTGAAMTNAIDIGGTGANTIAIGNTQTGGSISLGNAMTTGTLNIGGTGAHTGNIVIGNSTAANTLSIGGGGATAATINFAGGSADTGCTIDGATGNLTCSGAINVSTYYDSGITWTSRTTTSDNIWFGVTYGNGLFVAVSGGTGTGDRVITSPDGMTWTPRTSAADNQWRAVTYGNGLFVAVADTGASNRVMTSPNGITWTTRTSAANNVWESIAYGNNRFVAVASSGIGNRVMYSLDGVTWVSAASAADNTWREVTYGNGLFVAVASDGTGNRVMTSPDGSTWTIRTSAADNFWSSVTYGNGLFVAVAATGTGNRVMTSPDGITWTIRTSAADNGWAAVTYGDGLFVATAETGTGNRVMTSPDGITWTIRTSAADRTWRSIVYGNGRFVAFASDQFDDDKIMISGSTDETPFSHNNTRTGGLTSYGNLTLGGVGAETIIQLGNVGEVSSIALGTAMTTGTISIGGTGAQTGTMTFGNSSATQITNIGTGTGATTLNLGTGATSAKTVNIGTGAAMANTIEIGGTGANVIAIGNTQTAGSISLGAAMTTGTLSIGGTGAHTGNIVIANSTTAQTVAIGNSGSVNTTIDFAGGSANTGCTVTGGTGDITCAGTVSGSGIPLTKGVTWTARTSAADNNWISVAYGNGLFVAVANTGTGNRVMTSPDGITWTSRTSASNSSWVRVTYGAGIFVAVASSGDVMTSTDGITWTSRNGTTANAWYSVTYGNGLFVAVSFTGTGNRVMTSPDGITWTSRTSAADNDWYSVTYGNGLFVAVAGSGTGNRVMTSPDGITWTSRTSAANNSWMGVTYGNGLFVAVAQDGVGNRVMTSPNGITWTIRSSAADNSWNHVTYGNGLFVAVAYSGTGNRVMTSPDGITWTSRTSAADNNWYGITYGNGLFVAVAYTGSGNRVMTSGSPDTTPFSANNIYQGGISVFGNAGFGTSSALTALDLSGNLRTTGKLTATLTGSIDPAASTTVAGSGTLFTTELVVGDRITVTGETRTVTAIASNTSLTVDTPFSNNANDTSPDVLYAITTMRTSAGVVQFALSDTGNIGIGTAAPQEKLEVVGNIISKGTAWTSRTAPNTNQWTSVTYGNGLFVAVAFSGTGNRVMTSPDGINWTSRTSAADNNWTSIIYGNGLFVAVANSGTGNRVMTSPDGITWTIRTSAANNDWIDVTYGSGTFTAVANTGTGNRVMTSPDGITWTLRTSAVDNDWQAVTYGNGLFVAVSTNGTSNRVMTSPDGITWTSRTSAADNVWQAVVYANGLFVATATTGTGNRVMTSPDGITWTIRTSAADNEWMSVTYGNGLFVAVARTGTGNRVMTSPDGISWTTRTSSADVSWRTIEFGNGTFVAVNITGVAATAVMTSGKADYIATSPNNTFQGGLNLYGNFIIGAGSSIGIGDTAPDAYLDIIQDIAATNVDTTKVSQYTFGSTGTVAAGFGMNLQYRLETATASSYATAGEERWSWTDATNTTESSAWTLSAKASGTLRDVLTVEGSGAITVGGTSTPTQSVMTLTSQKDAAIRLVADTNDTIEDDNAYLFLSQDGAVTTGYTGFVGSAGNAPDSANTYTNTLTNALLIGTVSSDAVQLGTSGAVALTVEPSGEVGIGITTPAYRLEVQDSQTTGSVAKIYNTNTGTDADGLVIQTGPASNPGTANNFIAFLDGSSALIGQIEGDGAGGIAYNQTSDERLKENITPYENALETVNALSIKNYNMKTAPGKTQVGFIAQELYEVFPQVVGVGGEDPKTDPWSVDYGRITPLLAKAIQELSDKLTALEDLTANSPEFGPANEGTLAEALTIIGAPGAWIVTAQGAIVAKEIEADKVTAREFEVKVDDESQRTGEGTIAIGQTSVTVTNPAITPTSQILISFLTNIEGNWSLSNRTTGSFELTLTNDASTDIKFEYVIINIKDTRTPPTPEPPITPEPPVIARPEAEAISPPVIPAPTPVIPAQAGIQTPAPEPAPTPVIPAEAGIQEPAI